ncbi:hypothetical protein ACHWQZ_G006271 [Mnemiopsis leidyi]
MKFVYRVVLVGVTVLALPLYLCLMYLEESGEVEPLVYISDQYGTECLHQGTVYQEGDIFFSPCQECYCSFGRVECAVVHCTQTRNSLGINLITRSVQVLIPTKVEEFAGTIAVMCSVLRHTKHKVKFTLVLFQTDQDPIHANHLKNWIAGTELRLADYVIVPFSDDVRERMGFHAKNLREYWEEYQRLKQKHEHKLRMELGELPSVAVESPGRDPPNGAPADTGTAVLLLNSLLPREHRVIVLSNNVLVRGDVAELFSMDMQGTPVAVLKNCKNTPNFGDVFKPALLAQYAIPHDQCLFSQGVLVADLDSWFTDETESRLSDIMSDVMSRDAMLADQRASLAPLLLNFWNVSRDLGDLWNVRHLGNCDCNLGNDECNLDVQKEDKVLDWGPHRPWECNKMSTVWSQYYLPDPTGLFRLDEVLKS